MKKNRGNSNRFLKFRNPLASHPAPEQNNGPETLILEKTAPMETTKTVETLEQDMRLSECLLWRVQEEFYQNAGLEAWEDIPFYPTSNAFIGEVYADLIIHYLLDYQAHLNPDEPLYILEMATGSGCFSFYLIRELANKLNYFESLKKLRICYVMTDFTEKIVDEWKSNPYFQPYIQAEILDFAVFRPETDTQLKLNLSGKTLDATTVKNPVIAIANYFFDSIRQDLYRVDNGSLLEARFTFHREYETALPPERLHLRDIQMEETFQPVPPAMYEDPHLNEILDFYLKQYQQASVLFPIGAFRCIQNLQALSGNQVVLISSDKGYVSPHYVEGHWEQAFTPHEGAFSYMVNYQAIGHYFENQGGAFMATYGDNLSIVTTMGILHGETAATFEKTRYYFSDIVDKKNPMNYLYYCQDMLIQYDDLENPSNVVKDCLAFLKLCNYDPIVLYLCGEKLVRAVPNIGQILQGELLTAMDKVRDNLFTVSKRFNVLFWLGKLYYALNHFEDCRAAFEQSVDRFGPDGTALYYIAACHEVAENYESALSFYRQTQAIDPDCELTQEGITRMESKLAAS